MELDADTVVIGSGSGGLAAALGFAQAGERVLLFEQHSVPGGWCHSFHVEGHRFSPGVHYIGECGPGGSTRALLEGLGLADDLTFFELNPDGYDQFHVGDQSIHLPVGREALAERFSQRFPEERKALEAYFLLVETISRELPLIPETRSFIDFLTVPYRTRNMGRYGAYSLDRILRDRFKDPTLRMFLSMQCGDHGVPPARAPFALQAGLVGHYLNGAHHPYGGGAAIAKAFARGFRRAGGELHLSTSVEKILLEKRGRRLHAIGVRLADGSEVRCNRVVSNATPTLTYEKLVGRDHLSSGLNKKLQNATYSVSSVSLFLGTDLDLRDRGFDSGNIWKTPTTDHKSIFSNMSDPASFDPDNLPGFFMSVSTLKDPASYRGRHSVEVVSFVPYGAFAPYAESTLDDRPKEYLQLKQRLTDGLLRDVADIIPDIRENLTVCQLGTPLTNEHYVRATQGSSYGVEKVLRQLGPFAFKQKSEIVGLGLCGASVGAHGVAGAAWTGLALVGDMLRCRPSELLNDHGQTLRTCSAEDPTTWPTWVAEKRKRTRSVGRDLNGPAISG